MNRVQAPSPRRSDTVLDVRPLLIATGEPNVVRQANALHVNPRQVHRWLSNGIRSTVADFFACRLGLHPITLWPEDWPDEGEDQ